MGQRHDAKPRTCTKCKQVFEATAAGIKNHAKDCKQLTIRKIEE